MYECVLERVPTDEAQSSSRRIDMNENTTRVRTRINVSRTAKGFSCECSVEGHDTSEEELLAILDSLFGKLSARYPREDPQQVTA
jgi:hypothetical protein